MKKRRILAARLILLISLLLCAVTAAQAETPQPTKSAAQWESENYIVLYDSKIPQNYLVLPKYIRYLKEKESVTNADSGNKFLLANYNVVQEGASADGQPQAYCVKVGGKLYFGMMDAASDGNTLILNQEKMAVVELECITPQAALAVANYTLGAWIDWDPEFKIDDLKIKEIPFYFHGDVHIFLDHWSKDTSWYGAHHTIQCYVELNMKDMGFAADTETTTSDEHVPIFSYNHIKILYLSMKLDHFKGDLGIGFNIHDGIKMGFDTIMGVPDPDSFTVERDGPIFDSQLTGYACHGDADIGLEAGVGGTPLPPLIEEESVTIGFGFSIEGTDNKDRFVPADTKVKWHSCDECWNEDIRLRVGPVNMVIDLLLLKPWKWSSPDKKFDPFYNWYYSKTWDDHGEGECPHYSYRLDTTVVNQKHNPIPNASVSWSTDSRYKPQASGSTDSSGRTVIYVEPGSGREITAQAVSTYDPSQVISQTKTITKKSEQEDLVFTLDIPEKHVYFKNSETGESTDWPKDIDFMPFFSKKVQLPNKVPGLSGRVFTGWNTKEDGSGTSYSPGETLTLEDDLTLWARWDKAEDTWYVSYNANGGTKAPGPQIVEKGKDAVLSRVRPEAGKMIFKGWTPDKQHPDTVYQPGDTLKYDSEKSVVVLYALWDLSPVPKPIHISFSANGLQDAIMPTDIWSEMNTWLQLEPAFAPAGSPVSFLGWSEDPSAAKPEYQADRSYYFFRDTQLFAIWDKLDTVTLTFLDSLPDTSSGIPKPISILPSMSRNVYIPDQIPQKSGRIFTGWNTRKDGSGTAYAPGTVMVLQKNAVLWAQWARAEDSWYVVFNANGGTKAPGAQIIPIGQDAELTTELPENGTLTFKGWALSPDEAAAEYQPGDKLKYDSGKNYVVLYALWDLSPERRPAVITFKANGGLPDTVPHSISRPKMVWFELPESEPVWDAQHLFLGWSDNPEDTEAKWKAGDIAVFNQDTTLYAIWRAQYTVISGAGSVWIRNSSSSLRFIADGDIKYFVELLIDGKRFAKGVKITSGSTVAEIAPWALETLSEGTHTITFRYEDGEASAPFTISDLPVTGDRSVPALWLLLAVFGLAGMTLAGIRAFGQKKQ